MKTIEHQRAIQHAIWWYEDTFGYVDESTKETLNLIGAKYKCIDDVWGKADHVDDEDGNYIYPELSGGEYDAIIYGLEKVQTNNHGGNKS